MLQECTDVETQTLPVHQAMKAACAVAAVQTLPIPEPPEVSQLRSQASELQLELQRAVEALEQRVMQDQVIRNQAATVVASAEASAAEKVEATRKAADEAVAAARCGFATQLTCMQRSVNPRLPLSRPPAHCNALRHDMAWQSVILHALAATVVKGWLSCSRVHRSLGGAFSPNG